MPVSAIITADIVNSTLFSASEQKRFKNHLTSILKSHRFEYYRGDSFQVFIKDPRVALKVVLCVRTEARKLSVNYDVRCSVGIDKVNPHVRKLSTANDPAFILSGRAFDILVRSGQRLFIASANETANHGFKVICLFIDYLMDRLTEKQAEVISELLKDDTQAGVAKKLGKSVSTINKHSQTAGWDQFLKLLSEYDQLISIL